MDGELCAYCGKDESFGPMNEEHFVPRCLWVKRSRPRGMKTVPTHVACNSDLSADDEYFRDVIAFEEGAKNHPQIRALHAGPIKNKFLHTFGKVKKDLNNVGWYPVVTPSAMHPALNCIGAALNASCKK